MLSFKPNFSLSLTCIKKFFSSSSLTAVRVVSPAWVKLLSHVRLFAIPWTVAYQAPPSMEFSRQEYWSGLPFPSPEDLPNPGSNLGLPHWRQMLYRLSYQGSPSSAFLRLLIFPPGNLESSLCFIQRSGTDEPISITGDVERENRHVDTVRKRRVGQTGRWGLTYVHYLV